MANKGIWARLLVIIGILAATAAACASAADPAPTAPAALPEWETPALILFYTDN
jgi:hypothetical protein